MRKYWPWIAGAAVVAVGYLWLKSANGGTKAPAGSPSSGLLNFFPGGAANAINPQAVANQFADLSSYATQIQQAVSKNPSLGLVLGLSPQQTDYLALSPADYQKVYGFNTPQPTTA